MCRPLLLQEITIPFAKLGHIGIKNGYLFCFARIFGWRIEHKEKILNIKGVNDGALEKVRGLIYLYTSMLFQYSLNSGLCFLM